MVCGPFYLETEAYSCLLSPDDYYLLSPRPDLNLASPHRISVTEFSDGFNLVDDVLTIRNDPVVKLSSDKSGLTVEFDTNRKHVHSRQVRGSHMFTHGAMVFF